MSLNSTPVSCSNDLPSFIPSFLCCYEFRDYLVSIPKEGSALACYRSVVCHKLHGDTGTKGYAKRRAEVQKDTLRNHSQENGLKLSKRWMSL